MSVWDHLLKSLPALLKIGFVLLILLQVVPVLIYAERKISAFIQGRVGPNRVGPLGIFQPLADAVKFLTKEDFRPLQADRFLYLLAPMLVMIPPFVAFAVIPFGDHIDGVPLVVADLGIGILFLMAFLSVGVYGLAFGGWASNSKFSLLGGLRASAQMISYEVALTLTIITMVVWAQEVRLTGIVNQQANGVWNILTVPGLAGFILFFTAALAENNRLPFDLAECEAELVGGYHTEYAGMKFAMFFMGEYVAMTVMSALCVTFFFGGWHVPFLTGGPDEARGFWSGAITVGAFLAKTGVLLFVYIWIRWTLPRFRYDQLMNLGWKALIPLALANFALAAVWRVYNPLP